VVNAQAYQPDDGAESIADGHLAPLLKDGELQVGEEVADQSGALHAQWCEAVGCGHGS